MAELEGLLRSAASDVEWPETPELRLPAAAPRGRPRFVLVIAAAALAALGVAFGVPGARSAILRALHLEGVSIERVAVLPAARERLLGAGLGPVVLEPVAEDALGRPVALPPLGGRPSLRLRAGVVSLLLAAPGPVLLSELRIGGGAEILKKVVGSSTGVTGVLVGRATGVWITGAEHLYVAPRAPARLAGNVLLWETDGILYRLEGPGLTEAAALALAARIDGT